ncbi:TPA: hypothetical protein ACH3X2_006032 [Trebouxia sp. C0005]
MKNRGGQEPGHTVYVGNLPSAITQEALVSMLSQVGQVRQFRLMTDRQTGRHRGYGFCEYYHQASVHAAIKRINGQELQGRRLKVAALGGIYEPGKRDEGPERSQRPDKAQRPEGPHRPDHQAPSSQAAAKRARPSSSDTEHEPPQARPRLMPPPPPRLPSQAVARPPRHKQRQTEAVKVLNLFNTDEYTIHLAEHSPSNLLHIWLQREQDTCLFSVRLVGDVDHPHQHVGIGLADLLSHSLWAKISYDHKDDMQTCDWTAGGAVHVVVPVTTSPAAVRKVVQALYSGKIHLGDDAEEILLLASAMQVEAVTDACIPFLLQPDQLSAQQLVELYQTCYLTKPETQKQALQLLVNMPWTDEVYAALCKVFVDLVQQPELCKELLLSEGCGNMCGMQVCDLLTACGLSASDSLLPELLQFSTFESCEMRCLSSMVQADVKAASRELLEACVMHRDGRAWLRLNRTTEARATSRCTSLISSSSTRKEQVVRRFHMLDGCHNVFELTIPSRDSDKPCILTLQEAKIGDNIQRAGLYLLHHKAPFVKPLMSVAVNAHTTKVLLPKALLLFLGGTDTPRVERNMAEWLTLLDRLDIPDGAVTGLSASDKPVLKGKLLQLPAADRPLFFDGPPLEILKTLRTLLPDAPSGVSAPIDRFGGRGQDGQTSVLNSLVDSVKTIAEMVLRIQATTSETFDNIFAPNISELSQRTNLVTKTCTTAYNAENRPKDQLWCMVLGRYLEEDLVKASHIYKRRWPVTYAVHILDPWVLR